jgi:hypothetical protein
MSWSLPERVVASAASRIASKFAVSHVPNSRAPRALGGRQRDVELALRVLAVDEERAGEADGHLRDADEVLDVAGEDRRVERVAGDVLERCAGALLGELPARLRRLAGVVVLAVARDGDAFS